MTTGERGTGLWRLRRWLTGLLESNGVLESSELVSLQKRQCETGTQRYCKAETGIIKTRVSADATKSVRTFTCRYRRGHLNSKNREVIALRGSDSTPDTMAGGRRRGGVRMERHAVRV